MLFTLNTHKIYITQNDSSKNGLLLNVQTGSQELIAILSYATVCLHPSVSLNNEKTSREFSEHEIAVCEKMRLYGVGTLRI